jgi:hypothetical protein
LQSTNFTISCLPAAALLNAVTFTLGPLIPEFMSEFEYVQKALDFSFPVNLPIIAIANRQVKLELTETARMLILSGRF